MATNYSGWTLAKLEKEKAKIEKVIESREGKERKQALADMKAIAKKAGLNVKELLADLGGSTASSAAPAKPRGKKKASGRRKTGKVAPKYRNPADPSTTWTGRGRKPKWVEAHLAKHGNLDAVTI